MKVHELLNEAKTEFKIPEYTFKGTKGTAGFETLGLWSKSKKILWLVTTRFQQKMSYPGKLMYRDTSGKTEELNENHFSKENQEDFAKAGIPLAFVQAYSDTEGFSLLIDKTNIRIGTTNADIKKQEKQFNELIKGTTIKSELKNILIDEKN